MNGCISGIFAVSGEVNDPFFEAVNKAGEDRVSFTIKAPVNAVLHLEASDDLKAWSAVAVLTNTTGVVVYSDDHGVSSATKYYQAFQLE